MLPCATTPLDTPRELTLAFRTPPGICDATTQGHWEREEFLFALVRVLGLGSTLDQVLDSIQFDSTGQLTQGVAPVPKSRNTLVGDRSTVALSPAAAFLTAHLPADSIDAVDVSGAVNCRVSENHFSTRVFDYKLESTFGITKRLTEMLRTVACLEKVCGRRS